MFKLVLFVVLIFASNITIGQIDSLKNKFLVDGEISLGGSFQTGGLGLLTVKSTAKINVDFNKINSSTYLQYGFNSTFNNVIKNYFFGYEIVSISKEKRLHFECALMFEKSRIKSIDNHYVLGVGTGWNAISKPKYKLLVINTLSFEKKEFLSNQSLNYDGFRYSIILKGAYVFLDGKLIVNHSFFINPFLFNSNKNYRYRMLSNLFMPVSKRLSATISLD